MATLHRLRPAGRCPQGRPWPHQPRTLLAAIEELSECVRGLTAALVGDTDGVPHEPLHRPPAVDFDTEAAAQAEAEAAAAAEAEAIEAATAALGCPLARPLGAGAAGPGARSADRSLLPAGTDRTDAPQ